MSSIRGNFERQLLTLSERVQHMSELVDQAIDQALRSLTTRDSALAQAVIRNDRIVNELRYDIEEQCYNLLATQQPLAGDLRRVAATISIATNMERMADHAAGVATLAIQLNKEPLLKPLIDLPRMAEIARDMLRRSIEGYITADAEMARAVAADDDKIDALDEQVLRELITYMIEEPKSIRRATYLLWISHNLERIGDRCTNICERVIYVATGELADLEAHDDSDMPLDEHDAFIL